MAGMLGKFGQRSAIILARVKLQIEKAKVALLSMIAALCPRDAVVLLNDSLRIALDALDSRGVLSTRQLPAGARRRDADEGLSRALAGHCERLAAWKFHHPFRTIPSLNTNGRHGRTGTKTICEILANFW